MCECDMTHSDVCHDLFYMYTQKMEFAQGVYIWMKSWHTYGWNHSVHVYPFHSYVYTKSGVRAGQRAASYVWTWHVWLLCVPWRIPWHRKWSSRRAEGYRKSQTRCCPVHDCRNKCSQWEFDSLLCFCSKKMTVEKGVQNLTVKFDCYVNLWQMDYRNVKLFL